MKIISNEKKSWEYQERMVQHNFLERHLTFYIPPSFIWAGEVGEFYMSMACPFCIHVIFRSPTPSLRPKKTASNLLFINTFVQRTHSTVVNNNRAWLLHSTCPCLQLKEENKGEKKRVLMQVIGLATTSISPKLVCATPPFRVYVCLHRIDIN